MEKHVTNIALLFFTTFLLGISTVGAQTPWELKKEEDGIIAYTRSRPGIKFKEYKVEMTMDATHPQILALFKDYERYPDLFPGTSDAKALLQEDDHYITYIKFNIPFPARDRDALFDNKMSYDAVGKKLHIDVNCLTDEYETNPDLIQIKFCEGMWEFQDIGGGKMKVIHQLIVDPAGFAPAFIINSKTVDDPIKTYKALRKLVNEQRYSGHSFNLLEN